MVKQILFFTLLAVLSLGTQIEASSNVHWSYSGHGGPEHWADLSPKYYLAREGKEQSPVNLDDISKSDLSHVDQIHYGDTATSIINNGHTLQVNQSEGSYIVLDGSKFQLLQFHFHTPSENSINGKFFDMEMHLVHKSAEGQLAVLAVMIEKGDFNPHYEQFRTQLPHTAKHKADKLTKAINVFSLLPNNKKVYRFAGSLTTPPCSEGVLWNVIFEPVQLADYQLESFQMIMGTNKRPIQRKLTSK